MRLRARGLSLPALGVWALAGLAAARVTAWLRARHLRRRAHARLRRASLPVARLLDKRAPSCRRARGERVVDCSICLERLLPGQFARAPPCRCAFHTGCLEQWAFYAAARYKAGVRGAGAPACPNCAKDLELVAPRDVSQTDAAAGQAGWGGATSTACPPGAGRVVGAERAGAAGGALAAM